MKFAWCSCESWEAFQGSALHSTFRAAIFASDSWHWYRNEKKYARGPFPLARAADTRLSEAERRDANQEFVDQQFCCSCWGVGKK